MRARFQRINSCLVPSFSASFAWPALPAGAQYPDEVGPSRHPVSRRAAGPTPSGALRAELTRADRAVGGGRKTGRAAAPIIGAEIVAKSPPDGYTLLIVSITNAIGQSVYSKLNFDLVKDFAGITQLATTPHVLVVHPSVPVKSVKELIALAKARPGQLAYSSSGSGSAAHLAGEYFSSLTGVKMVHVPYKGGGPSMIALVGGEVSVCFATMPSAVEFVRQGKLRGLAVTTAKRSPSTPDLPTIAETGLKDYEAGLLVRLRGAGGHLEGHHRAAEHGSA